MSHCFLGYSPKTFNHVVFNGITFQNAMYYLGGKVSYCLFDANEPVGYNPNLYAAVSIVFGNGYNSGYNISHSYPYLHGA